MSVVYITEHEENVYDMLREKPPPRPKSPLYYSALEKELRKRKKPQLRLTMGWPENPIVPPETFLKKDGGTKRPRIKTDHKCIKLGNLPDVPKRSEAKKKVDRPYVNFRVVNIKKAMSCKPKVVEPKLIDQKNGHVKTIKGSGEVPEYSRRKDFGMLPAYLKRFNKYMRLEREARIKEEAARKSLCKLISPCERERLLMELKNNWAVLQKNFLQLPMLTDTVPKVIKKSALEKELKELEKDITLVESNKYIYVFGD